MQHIHASRNWKYVHHARKQSNDSLNASFESSHSNSSAKFNKFRFNRGDDSVVSRPEKLFTFTSGARNKPNDTSVLSRRSNKESDTSKKSNHEIAQGVHLPPGGSVSAIPAPKPRGKANQVKMLLKEVKTITYNFKKVVEYFSRKLKELQLEWDNSFRQLLAQQLGQQSQAMKTVKEEIKTQQRKLQQFARIEFDREPSKEESSEKKQDKFKNQSQIEVPPFKLAISSIEGVPNFPQIPAQVNRNATLMSLMSQDFNLTPPSDRGGREMRSLRQTIKRMREVLNEQ